MSKPIVAVVGRPNVGKSTLFNSLCGQQISIVKDTPGVTRDRIYAEVSWLNHNFTLIDTGGIEPDTGDIILSQMREQAEIAIETADVIIFIELDRAKTTANVCTIIIFVVIVAAGLAIAVVTTLIGKIITKSITEPVEQIEAAVASLRKGELSNVEMLTYES